MIYLYYVVVPTSDGQCILEPFATFEKARERFLKGDSRGALSIVKDVRLVISEASEPALGHNEMYYR